MLLISQERCYQLAGQREIRVALLIEGCTLSDAARCWKHLSHYVRASLLDKIAFLEELVIS